MRLILDEIEGIRFDSLVSEAMPRLGSLTLSM